MRTTRNVRAIWFVVLASTSWGMRRGRSILRSCLRGWSVDRTGHDETTTWVAPRRLPVSEPTRNDPAGLVSSSEPGREVCGSRCRDQGQGQVVGEERDVDDRRQRQDPDK